MLHFKANGEMAGRGYNHFGTFKVQGIVTEDGDIMFTKDFADIPFYVSYVCLFFRFSCNGDYCVPSNLESRTSGAKLSDC